MKTRCFALTITCTVLVHFLSAQNKSATQATWADHVDLKKYMQPFWAADTIYDEAIQPVKEGSQHAEGRLLFEAKKILSVRDTYLQKEYKEGKDWKYKDGKIVLTPNSSIPFFTKDELLFNEKKTGISMESSKPGHFILFSEAGLLQSKQLAITYIKKKAAKWNGTVPVVAEKQLPNTLAALKAGKPVNILFYGNSIESGANSSVTLGQSPYLPTWPEMITLNLRNHYGDAIQFKNKSRGGMLANWGLENADSLLNPEKPDLVVIGFGMNDGTFKVDPAVFIEQVKGIIKAVKAANPNCEFIVVATMLANPDAIHCQIQKSYQQPVLNLEGPGIAVADITGVHEELLKHKRYQDMTGNNVNHTNDYLARWYAQVISALLIQR